MSAASIGNIHIGLYVDVGDQRRFTDVANLVERDTRRMNTSLGHTTRSVGLLRNQMSQNMRLKLGAESLRTLSRATDDINKMRAALMGVAAISGTGLTGALGAGYLLQTADKARLLTNQLKTVTSSTSELNVVQSKLFEISQRTRSSMEATTTIYARTARATETLGVSQEKLLRITETVQKAFSIGGASTQEAQGAAIQLSQGIASNRFGGEEFRSVAENAPVLLRGIAESLDVDIGKLREMSMEGKLTADVLVDAIAKASTRIDKEFGMTTATVGQSVTMLDNAFLQYIGQTDKAYGVTKTLGAGLQGLADNFDEIMWWITRVSAGLAALYVARKVSSTTSGIVGGVREKNASIRQEMADLVEENKAIEQRRVDVAEEIAKARQKVEDSQSDIRGDVSDKAVRAQDRQFTAQQKLAKLEQDRQRLVDREIAAGRQMVRDNLTRVEQAREAAAAEERNLRARQAQALVRANSAVSQKVDAVVSANSRVQRTQVALDQARIKAEYAAQAKNDEARAKKAEEIEKRRRQLISNTIRLQSTQGQIAELRSVQGTEGFDQTFGTQYRSLLKDQQTVMASTQKVRKEIVGLQTELEKMPQSAVSSRSLTSAMAQHEKAVAAAKTAVDDLTKAEERRARVASTPISGKTLETRIAQEKKEIERYDQSVAKLVDRMVRLEQASNGAFSGASGAKLGKEFDVINNKVIAAQSSLKAASAALAEAQEATPARAAAALKVQEQALRRVNDLENEANVLTQKAATNVNRLAVAQKGLNIARRAASGVLDMLGGWTGIAMTASILAIGYFAAEAQKGTERTQRLKEELNALGLLSDEAAGKIDKTTKSLTEMTGDEFRNRIRELNGELERMNSRTGWVTRTFGGGGDTLPDIEADLNPSGNESGKFRRWGNEEADRLTTVKEQLIEIVRLAREGKTPSADLTARLNEIAKVPLSAEMDGFIKRIRAAMPFIAALKDGVKELEKAALGSQDLIASRNNLQPVRGRTQESQAIAARELAIEEATKAAWDDADMTERQKRIDAIMDSMIEKAKKTGHELFKDADLQERAGLVYDREREVKNSDNAVSGFVDSVVKAESGGNPNAKNPVSSATGLGQFIESTWLSLFKKYFPDEAIGKTDQQILNLRRNADKSREMIEVYARENKAILEKAGVSVDQVALQLAHFLGPQGAVKVLTAAPGTPVSQVLGQDAIKANPTILGGGKTVEDVISYGEKRAGMSTVGTQRLDALQKWVEELTDLDLQSKVKALQEFDQQVIQQAQSMGVTTEEIQKYIAAVQSGDLSAVPEKFSKIREAMKLGQDNEFTTKMQELKDSGALEFLSELDQKVIEMAKSMGVGQTAIQAYIEALQSGNMSNIPDQIARIREEMDKTANNQQFIDFANGSAEAIGGLVTDLFHGEDALKNFASKMLDLVVQIFIVEPLINSLKGAFKGLSESMTSGASGGGGLLGAFFGLFTGGGGSALPGKSGGGYTGAGGKYEPKAVVHGGEFVFDAESTRKMGPAKMYAMQEYLRTGNNKALESLFAGGGMSEGGLVDGVMSMPDMRGAGMSNSMSSDGAEGMSSAVRSSEGIMIGVGVDVDESGNLLPFVTSVADKRAQASSAQMAKKIHKELPETVAHINRNPRHRP